jgi:hypothetical protein
MAPLRNNPLFSKPSKSKPISAAQSEQGAATELTPLVGMSSSDSHLPGAPQVTTSLTTRSMCGEASTSIARASGPPPFQPERPESQAADEKDIQGDVGADLANLAKFNNGQAGGNGPLLGGQPPQVGNSTSSAGSSSGLYAKAGMRGPSRSKLQSHVD